MGDWFGECWRWVCGRGRRPNICAIITMFFLIVIAVQRREHTGNNIMMGSTDHRRRHSVSQQTDMARDLEHSEHQLPVIGLFILVNLDEIHDHRWNRTLSERPSQVQATILTAIFPRFSRLIWISCNKKLFPTLFDVNCCLSVPNLLDFVKAFK